MPYNQAHSCQSLHLQDDRIVKQSIYIETVLHVQGRPETHVSIDYGAICLFLNSYSPRHTTLTQYTICRRRVSVCLTHSGIVSKRLNIGSRK